MAAVQMPDVIAMLFADDIHHDATTHKFFVMGTYSAIGAAVFPWLQPALIVYLALTDGSSAVPLTMRLVDADEDRPPIFESNTIVRFSAPTVVLEQAFYQVNVIFPEAGEYRLQLLANGQLLRERRLYVWREASNGHP